MALRVYCDSEVIKGTEAASQHSVFNLLLKGYTSNYTVCARSQWYGGPQICRTYLEVQRFCVVNWGAENRSR